MGLYTDIIGTDATNEDYLNIADYFEEAGNHFLAGKFFFKAQRYDKVTILHTQYVTGPVNKSTMWAQIALSYTFTNIFSSEYGISFH